jgi:fructoselysine and glucoselysine-specific PTS system IIA component
VRKILLATHNKLAEAFKSTIDIIIGDTGKVDTLCAYTEDTFDLKASILEKLKGVSPEDELIVVTDVFGGSINNEFMQQIEKFNFILIAGMNLTLVGELVSMPDLPLKQAVEEAVRSAKEGIRICNNFEIDVSEEDF